MRHLKPTVTLAAVALLTVGLATPASAFGFSSLDLSRFAASVAASIAEAADLAQTVAETAEPEPVLPEDAVEVPADDYEDPEVGNAAAYAACVASLEPGTVVYPVDDDPCALPVLP